MFTSNLQVPAPNQFPSQKCCTGMIGSIFPLLCVHVTFIGLRWGFQEADTTFRLFIGQTLPLFPTCISI